MSERLEDEHRDDDEPAFGADGYDGLYLLPPPKKKRIRRSGRPSLQLHVDPGPSAPRTAREAADLLLSEADADEEFRHEVRLVVTELVTNAVVHGSGGNPIRLELTLYPEWAKLAVQNAGRPIEMTGLRNRRLGGGRGLEIVAALADRWSIDTGPFGTRFTVRLPRRRRR